jgi:hypothetical protein
VSKSSRVLFLEEAIRLDVASPTVTYVGNAGYGSATASAVWKIKRLTSTAGGNLTIEYANGLSNYNQIWDNRASLNYS